MSAAESHFDEWEFVPCTDTTMLQYIHLKAADAQEVLASHGMDPATALEYAVSSSQRSEIIYVHGRPEGVWGCAQLTAWVASPWLLSSEALVDDKHQLVRHGRRIIDELLGKYRRLLNFVDIRNTASRRWLKSIGFIEVEIDRHHGVARVPFVLMIVER